MGTLIGFLQLVLYLYGLLIFGRAVLSWFQLRSGTFAYRAWVFCYDATEPLLKRLRPILPPIRMGNAALDLSPFIALLIIWVISAFILPLLSHL